MSPVTPRSTATPITDTPRLLQSQWKGLREALRKANVPDDQANDVVNQTAQAQSYIREIHCHVANIGTSPDFTWVALSEDVSPGEAGHGPGGVPIVTKLHFPPNDSNYLTEFIRAQNYQIHIWLTVNEPPGQDTMIEHMYLGSKLYTHIGEQQW